MIDGMVGSAIGIVFVIVMVVLALIDIKSTKSPNHKNFKSSIILLGILGALSAIFAGLQSFDVEHIRDSAPDILYGLEVAFYMLFASLVLVFVIGLYQKSLGLKKDSKEDLDFITLQAKKLDRLDELVDIHTANEGIKEIMLEIKNSLNKSLESNAILLSKNLESIQNGFEMLSVSISNNTKLLIDRNKSHLSNIFEANARQIELLRDVNMNLKNLIAQNKDDFLALSAGNNAIFEKLQDSNKDLKESLIASLENLNANFAKEIKELSNNIDNALKERITSFISSFTNTINLYFSENFKRFNRGIDGLIEWQEKYKNDLDTSKQNIAKIAESMDRLQGVILNIIKRDEGMITLYDEALSVLKEYRLLHGNLNQKLQSLSDFGTNAISTLATMNTFFGDLNANLKETNANLIQSTNNIINNVFENITREFASRNSDMIDSISARNEAILALLESLVKNVDSMYQAIASELTSSIKESSHLSKMILKNNNDIYASYEALGDSIKLRLDSTLKHTSDLMSDINKSGVESLQDMAKSYFDDIADAQKRLLDDMLESLQANQSMLDSTINGAIERYLQSLEQITSSNSQAQIELSRASIEEIKVLNSEVSSHIKENALSLNKSNIEILNIIECLQKEIKDSMENSNILQNRAKESIKDIEESLHKNSESFKNDYEWFLRRIRDIIGQRI